MQLENGYGSRLRAEQLRPTAGLEERLALYRQDIEEQAKAEVNRQVGVVCLCACGKLQR